MKKLILLSIALLTLSLAGIADAAPKTAGNLKRASRQVTFPVVHWIATVKAIAFEALTYTGAAVDVVERGAAAVHAGVSKVDEAIDKIEDQVKPPAPPISPAVPQSQTLAIPGCTAKAFVPKGCYTQTTAELAEVRCPGQTFKFRCLPGPQSDDLGSAGPAAPGK